MATVSPSDAGAFQSTKEIDKKLASSAKQENVQRNADSVKPFARVDAHFHFLGLSARPRKKIWRG